VKIGERIESDHLPVEFWIKGKRRGGGKRKQSGERSVE